MSFHLSFLSVAKNVGAQNVDLKQPSWTMRCVGGKRNALRMTKQKDGGPWIPDKSVVVVVVWSLSHV